MDKGIFEAKMQECCNFFEHEISKEKLIIYWEHLKTKYTNDEFINKIDNIIDTDSKFPLLVDIHQASKYYNRRDITSDSIGISENENTVTRKNIE